MEALDVLRRARRDVARDGVPPAFRAQAAEARDARRLRHVLRPALLAGALGVLAAAPASAVSGPAESLTALRAALEAGDLPRAVREGEAAVKADPSSSEAQDLLGRAYGLTAQKASLLEQVHLAKRARACFSRAVELDPDNVAALADLARYDMRAPGVLGGGRKKSRATIDRVLSLDAERGNVLLGELAELEKKPAEAEAAYRRALDACPEDARDRRASLHERLAGVYERLGRNREAAAELEAALTLEPDQPDWRRRLARLEK